MTMTNVADSEPIVEERVGINVELLERVASYIEQHPAELDMDDWCKTHEPALPNSTLGLLRPCGTVACIAGHTVLLSGGSTDASIPAQAQRLLNLDFEQADRLFYRDNWPELYADKYEDCVESDNNHARAWVTSARIAHFIATEGKE